jgi:hypothetical protein
MKRASAEKQRLIDLAVAHGHDVTPKKIDRWRTAGLLPHPTRKGAGRGRGVSRLSPVGTEDQLLAVCRCIERHRSFHRAAFRLWIDGYPIEIARLRDALAHLAPNPVPLEELSDQRLLEESEEVAERILRRTRASSRVKAMAREGRLSPLVSALVSIGLGRPLGEQQLSSLAPAFEEATGLDQARSADVEGQKPWLSGDSTPFITELGSARIAVSRDLVFSATEEELHAARLAFTAWEKLVEFADLVQRLHGRNALGLSMLIDPVTGLDKSEMDPMLFLGMLAFSRTNPSIIEKSLEIGTSIDPVLQALRAQVEATTRASAVAT